MYRMRLLLTSDEIHYPIARSTLDLQCFAKTKDIWDMCGLFL